MYRFPYDIYIYALGKLLFMEKTLLNFIQSVFLT